MQKEKHTVLLRMVSAETIHFWATNGRYGFSYYLNDLTIYGTVVCSKITQIPWWTATFFIVTILILLEYSAVRLYFVQRVLYTIHFFKQAGSVVKSYKNSKRIFLLIV